MKSQWSMHEPDQELVALLVETLGCHRAAASALVNRGILNIEQATAFLNPTLANIRSPFQMHDMDKAVARVLVAMEKAERVLVFGDYDVDGMTATALLFNFLKELGIKVEHYIPDRFKEGYGLGRSFVEQWAKPRGINLIITVDCGISSRDAVNAARLANIDVIITDHHAPPSVIPNALAILNPKKPDCPSGFTSLAGVGIAFCFVLALRKSLRDSGFWQDRCEPNLKAVCDLVALGTVADIVPLVDENRIYVKTGLDVIAAASRPGIRAMLEVCKIEGRPLSTQDLAFKLAPRLNVAGRLRHGSMGFQLLTTIEPKTAQSLALELHEENRRRQEIEKQILLEIDKEINSRPRMLDKQTLVVYRNDWHEGVLGIVAARLVEQHMKPTAVISLSNGMARGSARTPEGLNLFEALKACSHLLHKFGGHKAAAGFSLKTEDIPSFMQAFEKSVGDRTLNEPFIPKTQIDGEVSLEEVSPAMVDDIGRLAPFGAGNPEPIFMLSRLEVITSRPVGLKHLQMRLRTEMSFSGKMVDAILFNADLSTPLPRVLDRALCHIRWNHWRDGKSIQLIVKDWFCSQRYTAKNEKKETPINVQT